MGTSDGNCPGNTGHTSKQLFEKQGKKGSLIGAVFLYFAGGLARGGIKGAAATPADKECYKQLLFLPKLIYYFIV